MYKIIENNRTVLMVIIFVVVLGVVFGGTYFLLRRFVRNEIFLDKHTDIVKLCDTEAGTGVYKCNLLLQDLVPNVEGKTCFDVQVISYNTIVPTRFCEEAQYLTLSNEIVQYKRFKPLIVTFTYEYNKLTNILFEPISSTYIQDLVNMDINEITQIEEENSVIANSFDFCPNPETLPEYVQNVELYTSVYNERVLSEAEYNSSKTFDEKVLNETENTNPNITTFLACKSSKLRELNNLCGNGDRNQKASVAKTLKGIFINDGEISWVNDSKYEKSDDYFIVGSLSDRILLREGATSKDLISSTEDIKSYFSGREGIEDLTICTLLELSNVIGDESLIEYFNSIIIQNLDKSIPPLCFSYETEELDKDGMYIKTLFSEQENKTIFNRCINLSNILK